MVEVEYSGNLGHWLFQYCFGRIVAEKSGLQLDAIPLRGFPGTADPVEGDRCFSPRFWWLRHNIQELPGNRWLQASAIRRPQRRRLILKGGFQRAEFYLPHADAIRHSWLRFEGLPPAPDDELLVALGSTADAVPGEDEAAAALTLEVIAATLDASGARKVAFLADEPGAGKARALADRFAGRAIVEASPFERLRRIASARLIAIGQCPLQWWGAFLSDARTTWFPPTERGPWSRPAPVVDGLADEHHGIDLRVDAPRFRYLWDNAPERGLSAPTPAPSLSASRPPARGPEPLCAVTICSHYSDYLAAIEGNREHFDRWMILTTPDDADTVALCRRLGLECIVTRQIERLRVGFNPAFNKGRFINEAIDALGIDDGWLAVLDADVHLPRDFRERLDTLDLVPGTLYGLGGRLVCRERHVFELYRDLEPWDYGLSSYMRVLGFMNLFHLQASPNRYPPRREGDWGGPHDDIRFQNRFGPKRVRFLPFNCLHVGHVLRNWSGRTTERFAETRGPAVATPGIPPDVLATLDRLHTGGGGTAVLVGFEHPAPVVQLSARFTEVLLVDKWGLTLPSEDPLAESDRRHRLARFEAAIQGLPNVRLLGPHSRSTIDQLADGSVDAFVIAGEPTYHFLLEALPLWMPKLAPGAALLGSHFDPGATEAATTAVSLLVGRPDFELAGSWWIKLVPTRAQDEDVAPVAPRLRHRPPSELRRDVVGAEGGTLLVVRSPEEAEACVAAAVEARHEGRSPVCVVHAGAIPPPLLIALTRAGAAVREVPASAPESGSSAPDPAWWSPFAGTSAPEEGATTESPSTRQRLLNAFSVDVRVGSETGVVVPVSADDLPLLADLLVLLRIPPRTPLVICPTDAAAEDAVIAAQIPLPHPATLVPIASASDDERRLLAALAAAADRAPAASWALLSPAAVPMHGADLFTHERWRHFDIVAPAEAFTEIDEPTLAQLGTSDPPMSEHITPGSIVRHIMPGPPISLFSAKAIQRLAALPATLTATEDLIGLTLACLRHRLDLSLTHADVGTLGWRM